MSVKDVLKNIGGYKYSDSPITLWKDKSTGKLRWLAAYSSNYLDDDYPSDILSKEAHINFISKVQNKELPYPQLWIWHLKGTAIGEADYLFYDEENGIAMATGFVYTDMEKVVKNIAKMNKELGTSHGMTFVKRNENDEKVIDEYVTIEISILPLVAAANKMTSIYILDKEKNMMSTEQKDFLKNSGMSDEDILAVESRNKQLADENSLRERKSIDGPDTEGNAETEEVKETSEAPQETEATERAEAPVEEAKSADVEDVDEDSQAVTVGQLKSTIEYLTGVVTQRLDNIEKALTKSVEELAAKNQQLEKSLNEKSLTPGNTLSSIVGKGLIDKSISRSPYDAPVLEKNDPLYNDAPAETPLAPEGELSLRSVIKKITGEKN